MFKENKILIEQLKVGSQPKISSKNNPEFSVTDISFRRIRAKISALRLFKFSDCLISILIGLVVTVGAVFYTGNYSEYIQSGISDRVIRFHVLANSNSENDQELKIKVRDGILEEFKTELSQTGSREELREVLSANLQRIEICADRIITGSGYDYSVSATLTKDFFPTRVYGDVVFPAGNYEALRIEIGEAIGNNWWCVVFPPLCYVDVTLNEIPVESKEELKEILSDEEYAILLSGSTDEITPKIKFKIVEVWQEIRNYLQNRHRESI